MRSVGVYELEGWGYRHVSSIGGKRLGSETGSVVRLLAVFLGLIWKGVLELLSIIIIYEIAVVGHRHDHLGAIGRDSDEGILLCLGSDKGGSCESKRNDSFERHGVVF